MGSEIESISQRIAREILDDEEVLASKDRLDRQIDEYALGVQQAMELQKTPVTLEEIKPKIRISLTQELTERLSKNEKWSRQQIFDKLQYLGLVN